MRLDFDADVEAFRAEFVDFLNADLPTAAEASAQRCRSSAHVPQWARRWQCALFDNGWLQPGYPPEFGGRNATVVEQYVYFEELSRRRIYRTFNPQGVGIIAASLIQHGTAEQQRRWVVPILRADITAALGMSEPGAGSDLASLRTRATREGDSFIVNGQKVWTSGAHDADVIFILVRSDPTAPEHEGISVLLIPSGIAGGDVRPFASACGLDDVDFNEVFFSDVRVPVENFVGELNTGWQVANSSLGDERTLLWLSYADRLQEFIDDWTPSAPIDRAPTPPSSWTRGRCASWDQQKWDEPPAETAIRHPCRSSNCLVSRQFKLQPRRLWAPLESRASSAEVRPVRSRRTTSRPTRVVGSRDTCEASVPPSPEALRRCSAT
ncbi:hypothetical protein MMAD_55710 (plasmid) [Mycolicibacterium madagascariense]|uniref:Acyl-CoA dehydrogenase n=1 Tax=Mycolicibacterium madagascariense TaxID=212765 RepID=A0A7I7XPX0_9MYCO|nr:hypothetical protein MMAD_55710 [Mycolicibacterium madagascariense]